MDSNYGQVMNYEESSGLQLTNAYIVLKNVNFLNLEKITIVFDLYLNQSSYGSYPPIKSAETLVLSAEDSVFNNYFIESVLAEEGVTINTKAMDYIASIYSF